MVLPTGSVVTALGPPSWSDERYWDSPTNLQRRADAWFWDCGCAAEPDSPGRFEIAACATHAETLDRKLQRKQQLNAITFGRR